MSPQEIEIYKKLIPSCNIIFDVGCRTDNIFYEINPNSDVHLFDPEFNEALSVCEGVKYNNFALGDKYSYVDFHYHYGSILPRTDEVKFDGCHQTRGIQITTIEIYCNKNKITHIDYLKIDTEGYDYNVIKGCGEMLSKIKYIQFEDWDEETNYKILSLLPGYGIHEIRSYPRNFIATKEYLNL